jgi:hypothetical protein
MRPTTSRTKRLLAAKACPRNCHLRLVVAMCKADDEHTSAPLYTKETRGMITLITRAWMITTLLAREHRDCHDPVE